MLEAVVPELAVVLLSLPLKSCGWDLTDASPVRVTAESTRTPPRWSQSGVLAMSSMTTCNQVAFNLPSAKRLDRDPSFVHKPEEHQHGLRPFGILITSSDHFGSGMAWRYSTGSSGSGIAVCVLCAASSGVVSLSMECLYPSESSEASELSD